MVCRKCMLGLTLRLASCTHGQMLKNDEKTILAELLDKATNVVDLGNKWITFDLNIEGKTRCFMYHKSFEGFAEYTFGFEAISELVDCKR